MKQEIKPYIRRRSELDDEASVAAYISEQRRALLAGTHKAICDFYVLFLRKISKLGERLTENEVDVYQYLVIEFVYESVNRFDFDRDYDQTK